MDTRQRAGQPLTTKNCLAHSVTSADVEKPRHMERPVDTGVCASLASCADAHPGCREGAAGARVCQEGAMTRQRIEGSDYNDWSVVEFTGSQERSEGVGGGGGGSIPVGRTVGLKGSQSEVPWVRLQLVA